MLSRGLQHTLAVSLVFYIVSSPMSYRIVDSVVGGVVNAVLPQVRGLFRIAEGGQPTQYGILVHTVVFAVVAHCLLHLI